MTLNNRYGIKGRNGDALEVPQYFWMRIAMGLSLNEANPTETALKFYRKMSSLEYLAAGSTLVNAGTIYPQLANCFVMEMQDDMEHIAKTTRDVMWLTKGTGGIGLSVTKLRAQGSPIRSNNTTSTGPIPFMHTIDSILRAVSRGGKKFGALCFYMENWHLDFPEFLELRNNSGDPYRRTRTANTAVWISDEFMKRVQNDDDWYLFDPLEVSDLNELYGKAFSARYNEYVAKAEAGEMRLFKKITAREQFKAILISLQTTSHPWLTSKDTINNRALNNNTGTIHLSNLCTEITLPQDEDNVSVCNLASINLSQHLRVGETGALAVDFAKIEESARLAVRQLDNLIDITRSSVKEADFSNQRTAPSASASWASPTSSRSSASRTRARPPTTSSARSWSTSPTPRSTRRPSSRRSAAPTPTSRAAAGRRASCRSTRSPSPRPTGAWRSRSTARPVSTGMPCARR